jgi:hypothetical protein
MENENTNKKQIAYEKQLAALLAVGFSRADAEKALAAIKPVARQAAQEMPEARWQLAKALCALALIPMSDKHTSKETVFKLFIDAGAMATDAETLKADICQFLQKSTFANACKAGKKVLFDGGLPMEKGDAARYAADYITGKYLVLVGLMQAEQKKYFEAIKESEEYFEALKVTEAPVDAPAAEVPAPVDAPADDKAGV